MPTSLLLIALLAANPSMESAPSVPPVDSPSLSRLGSYSVGTRTVTLDARSPGGPARPLRVVLWYPAERQGAAPRPYVHELQTAPPARKIRVTYAALASPDAPASRGRFPLVIVSHGFRGWPESMSYLTENLASKGYVVAGIDHGDAPFADKPSFDRSFAITAATRARDQQRVLSGLKARGLPLTDRVDFGRVGLVGYSMGAFGALATAGGGYDPSSPALQSLPPGILADQVQGSRRSEPGLRAIVAIAPWGAQSPYRAWSTAGLQEIRLPMLLVAGEEDDISNYRDGIKWLFDRAVNSDRKMLLYARARHNVGGNPAPAEARSDFGLLSNFEEPVWRLERINAVNQHFITAFLDRHLKEDRSRETMLTPPKAPAEPWPGFQPRWSLGFDLISAAP